jgi:probable HAF family extracellular repeat protein
LLADDLTAHAYLWQNGAINDLNQIQTYNSGWELSDAHGINDLGNIVGWGLINNQEHAFIFYRGGVVADLGLLAGGTNSYALGLNNSNLVVGASSTMAGNHAVVWQGGIINDLNNLINMPGWELREACGINDLGQIVGWGMSNGQGHAYLLTPSVAATGSKHSVSMASQVIASGVSPLISSLAVSITNPVNNASFSVPTNLTINATTTDSGGTVTQVVFYAGSRILGLKTNSPYSVIWSNAPVGLHALSAVAMDNASLIATSSVVNVSITTNLLPVADSYVQDGSSTNKNFGTNVLLQCLTTTTNGNNRDIYFLFNLTGITNVSSARLNVFAQLSSGSSVSNAVYSVTNTSWMETNITWNNKPARVSALATNSVTGTNWFSYDVSSYVKSQLAAGQSVVSLALHDPTNYSSLISVN